MSYGYAMGHTHAAMGDDPLMAAPDAQLLVVEDDEVVATFLVELLGRLGAVHWTTTAEQALTVTATRDWDVVISDIDLPGMNGLEFLGALQAPRSRWSPTLVLSGHSSFDHAVAALRAGADDYLTKPVDPAALLEKARALIAVTRERRAKGQEVVLAVGAHPDDVEIGVGGDPAAPRRAGPSRNDPDADRRRAGRRRARTARRSRGAPPT